MKKVFIFIILVLICKITCAHDFVITQNNQKIYFSILDDQAQTAQVTYNGSIADFQPSTCEGKIMIPTKVRHNDIIYTIIGVGPKAFSGADKLTGIVLPESIKEIGDFAFEGCASLEKIIFPSNPIKFGQGTFFKCDKLRDIILGENWTEINLQRFRWSDSLRVITIPAKIERIRNFKSLKNLEEINIDSNNTKYTSIEGILFDKTTKILYACPRAYNKKIVTVPEGTEKIINGAFIDCKNIETIDLPHSIRYISFREFSRMTDIEEIRFRNEDPLITAVGLDEKSYFLLQVANPDIKIVVPKKGLKAYRSSLAEESAEYFEINGTTPYSVNNNFMIKSNNIVGNNF